MACVAGRSRTCDLVIEGTRPKLTGDIHVNGIVISGFLWMASITQSGIQKIRDVSEHLQVDIPYQS